MAIATRIPVGELKVANTSNVKEMKNGRPMNVKLEDEGLENCVIVTLAEQPVDNGENDHVFVGTPVAAAGVAAAVEAGTAYLVVAPEIMVEEARKTDGHIGLFRFEKGDVHTAYQLSMHDRLEVSANHHALGLGAKVISTRKIAQGLVLQPSGAAFDGAELEMTKIEFNFAE